MSISIDENAHSKFPVEYLSPLKTALGNAWPRPRVRRIMEDLENVQKRMTINQQRRGGLATKEKKTRDRLWKELMDEYTLQEREVQRLMEAFAKFPATKEQFRQPDRNLSECCNAYVIEERRYLEDAEGSNPPIVIKQSDLREVVYKCKECGDYTKVYTRLEREDWQKEYENLQADRLREAQEQMKDREVLERRQKMAPNPVNPLKGGFLIT